MSYSIGHFLYNQNTKTIYKHETYNPDSFDFYYSEMLDHVVKRNPTLHKDIMTDKDRQFCRGRVFEFQDIGPVIVVGNWFLKYPEAEKLIKEIYNLPDNYHILVHEHWDIENNKDFI